MHPFYSPSSMATGSQGFDLTAFCTRIPIWMVAFTVLGYVLSRLTDWFEKKSVIFNFKTFSTVFPGWKESHKTSNLVPSIHLHSYPGKRLRRVLNSMSLIPPVADTFDYTDGFWGAKNLLLLLFFFTPALRSQTYRKIPKISPSVYNPLRRSPQNS